jgi:hypothetical protein
MTETFFLLQKSAAYRRHALKRATVWDYIYWVGEEIAGQSMIPKSGYRFSEKIMLKK